MPIFDGTIDGTLTEIGEVWDFAADNTPTAVGEVWDYTIDGTPTLIWTSVEPQTIDIPQISWNYFPDKVEWRLDYNGTTIKDISTEFTHIAGTISFYNYCNMEQIPDCIGYIQVYGPDSAWRTIAQQNLNAWGTVEVSVDTDISQCSKIKVYMYIRSYTSVLTGKYISGNLKGSFYLT